MLRGKGLVTPALWYSKAAQRKQSTEMMKYNNIGGKTCKHVVLSGGIRAEQRFCPQASNPTVHPHLSAFYLHPTDLLPSPSSRLPSTFIFLFFWPLHIISIFPASVAFSSHTPPPPSIQPPPPPPPPPPSRWRPHTERSADSLVVSHFSQRTDGGSRSSRLSAAGTPP